MTATKQGDDQDKRPRRTGVQTHLYLPPQIREAIVRCADANRRTLTEEIIIALEEYLHRQGMKEQR